MSDFITFEKNDGISVLTLKRPNQRNALNKDMRQQFIAALTEFNADEKQRALVITGAGERAFCAGQDLEEATTLDCTNASEWQEQLRAFLESIRNLDKPCVAAINGAAIGVGFYAALLCDIRIAHAKIKMGQPEINVGFPSIIGTRIMYMTLGHATTVELSLTGRLLTGSEAFEHELVTKLVRSEQVMSQALKTAAELAAKPPLAMKLTKQALREYTQDMFDKAIDTGKRLQPIALKAGEPQHYSAQFLADKC